MDINANRGQRMTFARNILEPSLRQEPSQLEALLLKQAQQFILQNQPLTFNKPLIQLCLEPPQQPFSS